jgi:2-polyprenyl-3-methyl-5-hydroxy-6-metoxy-1,4-benzoquinol methylase
MPNVSTCSDGTATLRGVTELRTPPTYDGDHFHERVREYADERPFERLRVLDAGCGRIAPLDLDAAECHVTGVDVDLPEVRARVRGRRDLDAWHLGDLRTVPMPPRLYDVVHAAYLIERTPHAELVLDRFVAALRPGGLMLCGSVTATACSVASTGSLRGGCAPSCGSATSRRERCTNGWRRCPGCGRTA